MDLRQFIAKVSREHLRLAYALFSVFAPRAIAVKER